MSKVENINECLMLQEDLDKIGEWSRTWQMEFNMKKCKVVEFGKSKRRVHFHHKMENFNLKKSQEEKDLGVTIMGRLTPNMHIDKITETVTNLLRKIKMAFS